MTDKQNEEEIDFAVIFRIIWSAKKLITVCFVAFEVLAVVLLHILTPTFNISMIVASPERQQSGLDGGLFGSVGSLMGLVGVGGQTNFDKYRVILVSNQVARNIVADQEFARMLYAGHWDDQSGEWRPPRDLAFLIKSGIKFGLGMEPWRRPDEQFMSAYLKKRLQFSVDKESGFLTVKINHEIPELAAELLVRLHLEANRVIRDATGIRTSNRIAYLNDTLPNVHLDSHRNVLIEMLSTEGQKMIMVEADQEFAAEMIEAPVVPKVKSTPNAVTMVVLLGLLGGLVGTVAVLWKSREQVREAWG